MRNYRRSHDALPERLERLQEDFAVSTSNLRDPETGTLYEYRILTETSYELCAQFSTASDGTARAFGNPMFWTHAEGRHCFAVDETTSDLELGGGVGFVTIPQPRWNLCGAVTLDTWQ
jgi:hypothetical protein